MVVRRFTEGMKVLVMTAACYACAGDSKDRGSVDLDNTGTTTGDSGVTSPRLEDRGPSVDECDDYLVEEWAYDYYYELGNYYHACLGAEASEPDALAQSTRDDVLSSCANQDIRGVYRPCTAHSCVVLMVDEVDRLHSAIEADGATAACDGFEFDAGLDGCYDIYWDLTDFCGGTETGEG